MAIIDIDNAFLHTENNEKILMLVRVRLAEIMVQVNPATYPKYVTYSPNEQAMLYIRLHKALYGMLRAALVFYKRLRNGTEGMGFEVNPYYTCVMNKTRNGHQLIVYCYVNNRKVPHKENDVVMALTVKLAKLYGRQKTI